MVRHEKGDLFSFAGESLRRPRRAASLCLLALLLAAGCSGRPAPLPVSPGEQMLRVGSGKTRVFVDAVAFEGKLERPLDFEEGRKLTLSFVPLAFGKKDGAVMELFLRGGGRRTRLARVSPLYLKTEGLKGAAIFDALEAAVVRVDLGPPTGKRRASLEWVLRNKGRPAAGAVGNLEIGSAAEGVRQGPDILFVCSDTHRFDYALGEEGTRLMPALGKLRKESVTYERAFSAASWTLPSIASVLTGLFPRFHGTGFRTGKVPAEDFEECSLPPGEFGFKLGKEYRILTALPRGLATLGEGLEGAGYRTAMVVSNPLYILSGLFAEGEGIAVDIGVKPGREVNAAARKVIETAPRDRPLFLLVHYMDVHHWRPWRFDGLFPGALPADDPEGVRAAYEAGVRETDACLASLLADWDETIGLKESLVVFYADHGEHLLDPGRPLLGHGNSQDEVLLHVPLVVHYPESSGVKAGRSMEPVSLVDLAPTALALAGADPGAWELSGRSLLDAGKGEGKETRPFFADGQLYGDEMSSVRERSYKLVFDFDEGTRTLLDLGRPLGAEGEPGQLADPSARNDAIKERLARDFEEYRRRGAARSARLIRDRPVDREEAMEKMKELGYVR